MIVTTFILCVGAFVAFIPWELSQKEPIVNIRLFKNRNFVISNIFMMVMCPSWRRLCGGRQCSADVGGLRTPCWT